MSKRNIPCSDSEAYLGPGEAFLFMKVSTADNCEGLKYSSVNNKNMLKVAIKTLEQCEICLKLTINPSNKTETIIVSF